jgi:hypothetical protein
MQQCIPEVFLGPFSLSETLNNQSWSAGRPGLSGFSSSGALYRALLNEPRIHTQERVVDSEPSTSLNAEILRRHTSRHRMTR